MPHSKVFPRAGAVAAEKASPKAAAGAALRRSTCGVTATATALGLGASLGVAFEPVAWPYVVPLAVAGLGLTLRGASMSRASWHAAVFGTAYMLTTLWWLQASIGAGAWLALGLAQGLWFLPLGWALAIVRRLRAWPLWSAALWSTMEVLRGSWPFGGFPWGRLGMTVLDTPWAALLPLLGISGTGFVLALLGFLIAAAIQERLQGRAVPGRALVALATVSAIAVLPAMFTTPIAESKTVTVALVQGGVPGDGTDLVTNHRKVTRNHLTATRNLARQIRAGNVPDPDLVIWPENSSAVDPFTDGQARAAIESAVAIIGRPLLVGGMVDAPAPDHVLNQGIVWDPTTGPGERYTKRHPVPFGEYIPFREVLGELDPRLAAIPRDMLPGAALPPLEVAGIKVAMAICFDIAFDDVLPDQIRRGADLVVIQTSNATFTGTAQRDQQFAISRARALETGRSVVVASTNGISGAIGPNGRVITLSQTRGTEVLVAEVPLATQITLAMRSGSALSYFLVTLAAGAVLAGIHGRRPLQGRTPTATVRG